MSIIPKFIITYLLRIDYQTNNFYIIILESILTLLLLVIYIFDKYKNLK